MDTVEQTLTSRIRRLEILLGLAVLLALAPWVAICGAVWWVSSPRLELRGTLVARGLEVRDAEGKMLARLAPRQHGGALDLMTDSGQSLAGFGPGAGDGAALRLSGANGKEIAYFGVETAGGGNLTLRRKDGEILVVARDNDGHGGGVATYRGDEKPLGFLGGGLRDDGALQLWSSTGPYAMLCTNQFGEAEFQLLRPDGTQSISAGIDANKEPLFVMRGSSGKAVAMIAGKPEGGELCLYDPAETMRSYLGPNGSGGHMFEVFNAEGEHMCALGELTNHMGGFFKTYGRGEHVAVCASVNDRDGAGIVSVHHPSGQQIFAAGMSGDGKGGIINVHDLSGNMILRTP